MQKYEYYKGTDNYFVMKNSISYIYDADECCFSALNGNGDYHNEFGPARIEKNQHGANEYCYIDGVHYAKPKFDRYICLNRIKAINKK